MASAFSRFSISAAMSAAFFKARFAVDSACRTRYSDFSDEIQPDNITITRIAVITVITTR